MPAITLTDAVPKFVSQEEYSSISAATPSSFNDLPAILKHQEDNVSVNIQPPIQGFSEEDAAKGTLYVLTSVLVFASSTGRNFQIEYPSITLHAIQRSDSKPSIYCQLDEFDELADTVANGVSEISVSSGAEAEAEGEEEVEEESGAQEEDEYTDMRELSIFPSATGTLDTIFEALSQCAALHPDKLTDDEDMDDEIAMDGESPFEIFTGDEDEELSEVGKAALAHLESIIYDPFHPSDDAVEDAEEEQGEGEKPKANDKEPAPTPSTTDTGKKSQS